MSLAQIVAHLKKVQASTKFLTTGLKRIAVSRIFRVALVLVTLAFGFIHVYNEIADDTRRTQALNGIKTDLLDELRALDISDLHPRTDATNFDQLSLATGGKPISNVIVTTFRSGSNFLEDVLASYPGSNDFHEILWHFGCGRIRDLKKGAWAVRDVSRILHCDYELMDRFLKAVQKNASPISRNPRVWKHLNDEHKYSLEFLEKSCKMFPIQTMKLTRMLLRDAETLLLDDTLNIKIIFLVRDPRGMLLSRWELAESRNEKISLENDWYGPFGICRDLETDFAAAREFQRKYPDRFTVVRYEDFASDALQQAPKLFKFLEMKYHERVENFLREHTTQTKGDSFSTFRDSNATVFHWKDDLTYEQVEIIQRDCMGAMNLWGYKVARSERELRDNFYPIHEFDYSFSKYND